MTSTPPSPVTLSYPFTGRWRAKNSPARRIPSHGTDLLGTTYAIDFVAVGEHGRGAPLSLAAAFGTEDPERFVGFGAPILAPLAGRIVESCDGEGDHVARRSHLSLLGYAATQGRRLREGVRALAGNYVVIDPTGDGPFVLLAHLRRGSIRVRDGEFVEHGQQIAECGNSGNSTQPHLHLQATDTTEWEHAAGLPLRFCHPDAPAMPGEAEIVEV